LAEWLIEEGIGEHRAILLDGARVRAARLDWPGNLGAGQVEDALLLSRATGSKRGTARFSCGEEALVDQLPREASEGAAIRLEVMRPAMAERDRTKLARARPTAAPLRTAPSLAETLRYEGHAPRLVRNFPACDWDELWDEAWSGAVEFPGGRLEFAPTSAMTVIDVDGDLAPHALALAAVAPLAQALTRLDLSGNIGVDFPTLEARADRKAVDLALAAALGDWPHERTAMNGFGFVQIVARLQRLSLLHRLHHQAAKAAAMRLLRRAERIDAPGTLLLTAPPSVRAAVNRGLEAELMRRTGRDIAWQIEPTLAPEAAFAQALTA